MNEVVSMYKKIGETPLEALGRLRKELPQYAEEILSYAGRLDPMASGVMLVLVGDANKSREKYLNLTKQYATEIVFGVSTDTYDTLGLVTDVSKEELSISHIELRVRDSVASLLGTFSQKYPEYSSKPVEGVPLFVHARAGKRVAVPSHDVTVFSAEVSAVRSVEKSELRERINKQIDLVVGDFRQSDITDTWKKIFDESQVEKYIIADIVLSVSSGFYVRQYAHDLGTLCAVPACALSITRTKVGEWGVEGCAL